MAERLQAQGVPFEPLAKLTVLGARDAVLDQIPGREVDLAIPSAREARVVVQSSYCLPKHPMSQRSLLRSSTRCWAPCEGWASASRVEQRYIPSGRFHNYQRHAAAVSRSPHGAVV